MAHPNLTSFAKRPVSIDITGVIFGDIITQVQSWLKARATRRALADLSDTQLEDIGLTRGDIHDIARKGFKR